jgi:hydroxyethylthiazole kinase-like uncharacterized protein yjeF
LYGSAALRQIEAKASSALPHHTLMQRAGLATAKLALALAPQARRIWIAAGPGNNGGDGFEAALHLHAAGKEVHVSHWPAAAKPPADAAASQQRALAAGVGTILGGGPPPGWAASDLAVDALLGIGATRTPEGALQDAVNQLNSGAAPVLAIDVPSGLDAERGICFGTVAVRATWTLTLLGLKPGLFTSEGRDHAGAVWLDDLGICPPAGLMAARLLSDSRPLWPSRLHVQHKGSFGDVWVVGGAPGMTGAALLAAQAALAAGAGRVYLAGLDDPLPTHDAGRPELMHRSPASLREAGTPLEHATVVCGCGGGEAVHPLLPVLLSRAGRLLLDADALNALAIDPTLARLLEARGARGRDTLLTPHPLEAARLLGTSTQTVQADRLAAATALARRYGATVVLKGSGTVIAGPAEGRWVNASGNACLASPGTGDVLAGWIGGLWAQGLDAAGAARLGVHTHGFAADSWAAGETRAGPLMAQPLVSILASLRRG